MEWPGEDLDNHRLGPGLVEDLALSEEGSCEQSEALRLDRSGAATTGQVLTRSLIYLAGLGLSSLGVVAVVRSCATPGVG